MYRLLRKLSSAVVLKDEVETKEEALLYLRQYRFGLVEDIDGNIYSQDTIEELENAESIRPEPRVEYDSFFTRRTEISEDTDRELSETDTDTTE
jgi:phage terminase large subunit